MFILFCQKILIKVLWQEIKERRNSSFQRSLTYQYRLLVLLKHFTSMLLSHAGAKIPKRSQERTDSTTPESHKLWPVEEGDDMQNVHQLPLVLVDTLHLHTQMWQPFDSVETVKEAYQKSSLLYRFRHHIIFALMLRRYLVPVYIRSIYVNKVCTFSTSVSDPDPHWIRIQQPQGSGSGIRIPNADPGSGSRGSVLIFFGSYKKWL